MKAQEILKVYFESEYIWYNIKCIYEELIKDFKNIKESSKRFQLSIDKAKKVVEMFWISIDQVVEMFWISLDQEEEKINWIDKFYLMLKEREEYKTLCLKIDDLENDDEIYI